eukprot:scaffold176991_cov56-Attheya_sp.AAC.1
MAIAPSELRTIGEGDAMCATAGNAFRGVSIATERVSEPLLHNTADSNTTPDHWPHAIDSNWQIIAQGISVV